MRSLICSPGASAAERIAQSISGAAQQLALSEKLSAVSARSLYSCAPAPAPRSYKIASVGSAARTATPSRSSTTRSAAGQYVTRTRTPPLTPPAQICAAASAGAATVKLFVPSALSMAYSFQIVTAAIYAPSGRYVVTLWLCSEPGRTPES